MNGIFLSYAFLSFVYVRRLSTQQLIRKKEKKHKIQQVSRKKTTILLKSIYYLIARMKIFTNFIIYLAKLIQNIFPLEVPYQNLVRNT